MATSPAAHLTKEYAIVWGDFIRRVLRVHARAAAATENNSISLHNALRALHWVPYRKARELLAKPRVDESSDNIGAVTGLFFEQSVVTLTVSHLRRHVRGVHIERNCCSSSRVRVISKDPDLYARAGRSEIVVEIKVSPKRRDLDHVFRMRQKYEKQGIGYFLIGGYVSAARDALHRFAGEPWACFTSGSDRNTALLKGLPTLDIVLNEAVARLAGA